VNDIQIKKKKRLIIERYLIIKVFNFIISKW